MKQLQYFFAGKIAGSDTEGQQETAHMMTEHI